ncbi:MAG: UDP-N-acetylmuramoyl-L-alanyl-D-glutamate--2,6-diaminopimelate ligase [Rhodothermaceae bacterium]|nr:MAG: UDP-N-acetylmuramoyl-L-alanyl-D-glutamate--2,6-diaminopimelate ligase [Rhodothermaceae bacterium]
MIALRKLYERLVEAGLLRKKRGGLENIRIDHLAHDSRKVGPGGLFVAVRGEKADGHLFIDKAVQNGAIAIVCEAMPAARREQRAAGIAWLQVHDSRAALAELAAAFFGDPSRALKMTGITGTNGKTTTAYLVHHVLAAQGLRAGLIGTVTYDLGGTRQEATHTTPDALELQRMLRRMVDAGCAACVMEVSSHALDQERVRAIDYDVAIFTNLTRDHLDYHRTFEAYFAAKKKLFDRLGAHATALYNRDDPAGARIVAGTAAQVLSYGQSPEADLRLEVLANRIGGLHLRIDGQERRFRLVGLFNAYNLAAAYGAGRALGLPPAAVLDALATAPPVPGRFEQLRFADGTTVIVDYAHTPDALENVLKTIRVTKSPAATLWCVFGCGGDRDPDKRRLMGAIAERYADRVIVTSDNPRTEDPEKILNDIRRGMDRPTEALWIVDRREAIRQAAARAAPGDVVLIAGKGHETYQIIGTEKLPFDDREEARRSFADRGLREGG